MHVMVAGTRSGAVLDASCPFFSVPLTCDGYAPYRRSGTIRRRRAHILRDAECLADGGRAGEPPYRQLRPICHNAKRAQPDTDCNYMMQRTGIIAAQYGALGHGFGGKPADAAPGLSTFVSRSGMEPTNNTAVVNTRNNPIFSHTISHACNSSTQEGCGPSQNVVISHVLTTGGRCAGPPEVHTAGAAHHRRNEDVRHHDDMYRDLEHEGAECG